MPPSIHHAGEADSNALRDALPAVEPKALRTFTPTQAVLARSAGAFHWTPEGRRLYDFTSGVLDANLGHNPLSWKMALDRHMGWDDAANAGWPYFREQSCGAWIGLIVLILLQNRQHLEWVARAVLGRAGQKRRPLSMPPRRRSLGRIASRRRACPTIKRRQVRC